MRQNRKKFICPFCHKKTFVKYVDNTSGSYLDDQFGKCDREQKCATHYRPNKNSKINILINNKPKPKPDYHSLELFQKSILDSTQNNFKYFLKRLFSKEEANMAILKYHIGTSKKYKEATIFWQIDQYENIHAGKIMLYDKNTGKRVKSSDGKSDIHWVHKIKSIGHFNLEQCLFGLHLIIESNQQTLAIVESEKTAVIMSVFKPQYIWLATGSKHGFKKDMLQPIKSFKIVAFPDKGEYSDWKQTAINLNAMGYQIIVSEWLEQTNNQPGVDLADVFINEVQNSKTHQE